MMSLQPSTNLMPKSIASVRDFDSSLRTPGTAGLRESDTHPVRNLNTICSKPFAGYRNHRFEIRSNE